MVARKDGEREDARAHERRREREGERRKEKPSHRTRASAASPKLCRLFRTVGL